MDETGSHYVKRNKLDTETNTVCSYSYMKLK